MHFNAWSNGNGPRRKMPLYDEAFLQVQWVQIAYNRTVDDKSSELESRDGSLGCSVVCSIDYMGDVVIISESWEGKVPTKL